MPASCQDVEQKQTIDKQSPSVYSLLDKLTLGGTTVVITRATEYAIRTVIFLAQQPKDEIVLNQEAETNILIGI